MAVDPQKGKGGAAKGKGFVNKWLTNILNVKDKTGGDFGPNLLSKDMLTGKKWKLDKGQKCRILFYTFELRDITDIKERKKKLKDSFGYDLRKESKAIKNIGLFTLEITKKSQFSQICYVLSNIDMNHIIFSGCIKKEDFFGAGILNPKLYPVYEKLRVETNKKWEQALKPNDKKSWPSKKDIQAKWGLYIQFQIIQI